MRTSALAQSKWGAFDSIGLRTVWTIGLVVGLIGLTATFVGTALAQFPTTTTTSKSELEKIISEAHEKGVRVIVVDPGNKAGAGEAQPETSVFAEFEDDVVEARTRLKEILAAAPLILQETQKVVAEKSNRGALWPLRVIFLTAVFLAIGWAVEHFYRTWARKHFTDPFNPEPKSEAEKIAFLFTRGSLELVGLVVQVAIAGLLVIIFDGGVPHLRQLAFLVILAVACLRFIIICMRNMLAPETPGHRILNIDDAGAQSMVRDATIVLIPIIAMMALCQWMNLLGLDSRLHVLENLVAMSISILLACTYMLRHRATVANMIMGADDSRPRSFGLQMLARLWHVMVIIYLALAWMVMSTRMLLDQPNAVGLGVMPLLVVLAGIALYGAGLLIIEWSFGPDHRESADEVAAQFATPVDEEGEADKDTGAIEKLPTFRDVAKNVAAIVATLTTAWVILELWGFDLSRRDGPLAAIWDILLVGFLACLGWSATRVWFDRKIAEEGIGGVVMSDEGGGGEGSRLGTLLPLFRNFLLILVATIAGMIILSELGVNTGPLFAGAGIVGVAIGFGAQTLVRDILSGAFFLMDDAFRKGEYIDLGDVKGIVENISIRSMQLRHHRGPLNTVPFGEIKYLTNFSRDWVIMKLPLRVTYDTDIEKVRKLIKKLGQELLEDPNVGGNFMQPVKSQGVVQMDDSAMIIRVKFMTKPGDQWVIRKMVYAKIRELFEKEGIKFAHREVTVRVADAEEGQTHSPEFKQAVAGAAHMALQDETDKPKVAADDR